jgi:hypothetical protein
MSVTCVAAAGLGTSQPVLGHRRRNRPGRPPVIGTSVSGFRTRASSFGVCASPRSATPRDRLKARTRAFGEGRPRELEHMTDEIAGWQARLPERAGHGPGTDALSDQIGDDGRASPSARSPNPGATIAPGWAMSSSATTASVVSISAATEAACSRLSRVTRTGSITPFS